MPAKSQHRSPKGEPTGIVQTAVEIRIPSLRQVLDNRIRRRIRRNGLSDEMNAIHEERRHRAQRDAEELQRLRTQLAEKNEEIQVLKDTTSSQDSRHVKELEEQLEQLRSELSDQSILSNQSRYEWTMAARDPFSDSYMDDDDFGDTTMADLESSTPTKLRSSFPTPPCTSPTRPASPVTVVRPPSPTPSAQSAGVQAGLPDPEREALETELTALRHELTKMNDTLKGHESMRARVGEKLSAAQGPVSGEQLDMELQLDTVLQSLSDRTAALSDLQSSLGSLGFTGKDAGEVISSLSNAFRGARLELEYLTPGEITLPLSSRGAQVLDMVLVRLRDLARKVKEGEESIDEYHALELSLRQQLGARAEAMGEMSRELKRNAERLKEKDERIAELEVGTDRLKGAIEGYRRDVTELENLVQRLEEEGQDAEQKVRSELESELAAALEQAARLRTQLADVQAKKEAEVAALDKTHGEALALRDARVAELHNEIETINQSLRDAHETIRQLRVENSGLRSDLDAEEKNTRGAVRNMRAELEKMLRMSDDILASPKGGMKAQYHSSAPQEAPSQPTEQGDAYLSDESAGTERSGKRRRKYDSGLGFLDGEEIEF